MSNDCLFCKIISRELPSEILFEDKDLIVFKDKFPKAPVHVLLVPKTHIEGVMALADTDRQIAGALVVRARLIADELGLSRGYKLIFNVGTEGGQVIPHLHLHLLGGKPLQGLV